MRANTRALFLVLTPAVFAASQTPTFYKDVLPVVQNHCQECHRPGEVAPFPLMSYENARPWAKAIKQAVLTKKMPPWDVNPADSPKYANDRSLTKAEIDTLVAWSDAGAPAGNPKDAPPQREFAEGWTIGKPDLVVDIGNDFIVPANGTVEYQYILMPLHLTEDKWISALEVRPTAPAVVHHIVLHSVPPNGAKRYSTLKPFTAVSESGLSSGSETGGGGGNRGLDTTSNQSVLSFQPDQDEWIAEYFPGGKGWVAPPGQARFMKAGTNLVIQAHYTVNGKVTADRTRVGIKFAKEPPQMRAFGLLFSARSMRIPPGDPHYTLDTYTTIPNDITITGLQPHMHLRGSAFKIDATYPSGQTETLIDVPHFDFNWQMNHWLAEPRLLPKGTKLHMTSAWDNSANNKYNPDPTKEVLYGEQSWQEMSALFFDVMVPVTMDPTKIFPTRNRVGGDATTASVQ